MRGESEIRRKIREFERNNTLKLPAHRRMDFDEAWGAYLALCWVLGEGEG